MNRLRRHRRASILLGVLIALAFAVVLIGALVVRAGAAQESTSAELQRTRLRALAWSGVEGVMQELSSQRAALLKGGMPQLRTEWELFESSGSRGMVRLRNLHGAPAESELAKVDINVANLDALAGVAALSQTTRDAVRAARARGELASVGEVFNGSEPSHKQDMHAGTDDAGVPRVDVGARNVSRWLTVFAFDPEERPDSQPVVNAADGWSDAVGAKLKDSLSAPALAAIEAVLKTQPFPTTRGEVVASLRKAAVPSKVWGEVMDAVVLTDGALRRGVVDVNHAPVDVLATIPGIDAATAAKLIEARDHAQPDALASASWPVEQGVMSEDAFQGACDNMTTRSLMWRVVVEATIEPILEGGEAATTSQHGPRMVMEAVIDITGKEPRAAYLRELTSEALQGISLPHATDADLTGDVVGYELSYSPDTEPRANQNGTNAPRFPAENAGEPINSGGNSPSFGDVSTNDRGTESSGTGSTDLTPAARRRHHHRIGRWIAGSHGGT